MPFLRASMQAPVGQHPCNNQYDPRTGPGTVEMAVGPVQAAHVGSDFRQLGFKF